MAMPAEGFVRREPPPLFLPLSPVSSRKQVIKHFVPAPNIKTKKRKNETDESRVAPVEKEWGQSLSFSVYFLPLLVAPEDLCPTLKKHLETCLRNWKTAQGI